MQAWEYRAIFVKGPMTGSTVTNAQIEMTEHGKDGWEAFSVLPEQGGTAQGWWVLFKRQTVGRR